MYLHWYTITSTTADDAGGGVSDRGAENGDDRRVDGA